MYKTLSKYYDLVFDKSVEQEEYFSGLKKNHHEKALDLGCGTGNTTGILSDLGYETTGVDLDLKMIEVARKKHPGTRFVVSDLVKYVGNVKETYDLIVCLGNTVAHLNQNELTFLLKQLSKMVSAKGKIIIGLLNYEKILLERPKNLPKIVNGEISFERIYEYEGEKIKFTTEIIDNGKTVHEDFVNLFPHQAPEIVRILETLDVEFQLFCNYQENPFEKNSRQLIFQITRMLK